MYLEFRVLRPTNVDRLGALYFPRGDEPAPAIADKGEEKLETRRIELLDDPSPALISARGCELNSVASRRIDDVTGGLDLDADDPTRQIRDEVVVRAVK